RAVRTGHGGATRGVGSGPRFGWNDGFCLDSAARRTGACLDCGIGRADGRGPGRLVATRPVGAAHSFCVGRDARVAYAANDVTALPGHAYRRPGEGSRAAGGVSANLE